MIEPTAVVIEPTTEAEAEALGGLGWGLVAGFCAMGPGGEALVAYRAGFRDGRSVVPRVFCVGDPEPGPEVGAVLDRDGEVWLRSPTGWGVEPGGSERRWGAVLLYGPLVSCPRPPEYAAVVAAEERRRAAVPDASSGRDIAVDTVVDDPALDIAEAQVRVVSALATVVERMATVMEAAGAVAESLGRLAQELREVGPGALDARSAPGAAEASA